MTDTLRVYTNADVAGCEIGGSVKNVIALAAGMAVGLGYGQNTLAALITRGLAEMTRLGAAVGGQALTFLGLAGVGDLSVTCHSTDSRNHHVGLELGRGRAVTDILAGMRSVAEGVRSARPVLTLAEQAGIALPICERVAAVLDGFPTPPTRSARCATRTEDRAPRDCLARSASGGTNSGAGLVRAVEVEVTRGGLRFGAVVRVAGTAPRNPAAYALPSPTTVAGRAGFGRLADRAEPGVADRPYR